jgi:hypothetical protein
VRLLRDEELRLSGMADAELVVGATRDELVLLANALNEALEAVEGWEFDTRLGGSPDEARELRSKIKDLLHATRQPEQLSAGSGEPWECTVNGVTPVKEAHDE